MTQPIRLEDAVIVENEYGNIEEITSTYVVVRLWDWRRMIVPLTYFIEKPFQNWTRESSTLIGTVLIYVDYRAPGRRLPRHGAGDRQGVDRAGTAACSTSPSPMSSRHDGGAHPRQRRRSPAGVRPALRGAREADRLPAARAPETLPRQRTELAVDPDTPGSSVTITASSTAAPAYGWQHRSICAPYVYNVGLPAANGRGDPTSGPGLRTPPRHHLGENPEFTGLGNVVPVAQRRASASKGLRLR